MAATEQPAAGRRTGLGALIFAAAAAAAALGWGLVIQAGQRVPVEEATVDGLNVRLARARWVLDQMDHGENFNKPSVMMPDMPSWGEQRLTVELAFENRSQRPQRYAGERFVLLPELGDEVPPIGAQLAAAELLPGQRLNTAIHFDFDATKPHGKLRLAWRRGGEAAYLPVPEPPEHYHLRPRGGTVALPPEARLVAPLGDAARGAALYREVYGCGACHGDPAIAGSNNVGPHLVAIGNTAGARVEGMSAAQYIYRSILEPGAFIAPACKDGRPCTEPTAMPEYASLMSLQDIADVLVYLLERKG